VFCPCSSPFPRFSAPPPVQWRATPWILIVLLKFMTDKGAFGPSSEADGGPPLLAHQTGRLLPIEAPPLKPEGPSPRC